ncbi:phosphoribosylanthranilate isomerase [Mangrovibacterium lignilyticum]|uniref:phosphoribosylanthranilate isomerase n=1 Tax=Mangrovibacterium lignilyticum TaxID=2668052 RepID=UPI0013D4E865|nr:phosphoribosylanthranilate isomerase [Mangrovibacterium lignilyticum]
MREPGNIDAICSSMPDYLGFIFYPKSKRFVGENPDKIIFDRVPPSIQKVGVFVNEEPKKVIEICHSYKLAVAQLHGQESPEYCQKIKDSGVKVFKAFSIDENFDFKLLNKYEDMIDYFLFDTKGKLPGGTGEKFNWQVLNQYKLNTPFFLSGGIGPKDCEYIISLGSRALFAVDINSGFETQPTIKEPNKVADFIQKIRN